MMASLMGTFCFLSAESIFLGYRDRLLELEPGDEGFSTSSAVNRQWDFK